MQNTTQEQQVWLTRPEVAARLRVPVTTVAQWASQGRGPRFAKIGRFTRYALADVLEWEAAQYVNRASA